MNLPRSSLRILILLSLLLLSLPPLALTAFVMYRSGARSLKDEAFARFEVVRTITAKSVEHFFTTLRNELLVTAGDRSTLEALRAFNAALASTRAQDDAAAADRRALATEYARGLATELHKRGRSPAIVQPLLDSLDHVAARLQSLSIAGNSNPTGSKHLLDTAGDDSAYTAVHAGVHPAFRRLLERYGVYDVFLVDAASRRVVYTVFKEVETPASRAALDQNAAGTALGLDYRGERVLSSWQPLTVFPGAVGGREPVRWALISEIDESEVLAPAHALRNWALGLFAATAT